MQQMVPEKYDPRAIEGKWQQAWSDSRVFNAPNPADDKKKRPKYYCLCMFPYPSGAIHMGHLRNYAIGDIISRYKRMKGFNVVQPIGWDAFGLPAENAAISRGVHPRDWTLSNIAQMKVELSAMGISYDWDRELATCLPEYFKWEQLFFERFFEEGLAYKRKAQVNWCEKCQTVLANEQVHEGKCWRCDTEVKTKDLEQWYLRITLYADQLLSGHDMLQGKWPDRILEMQKHWIGKSEGARIQFPLAQGTGSVEVFTTRADTLFGVTFVTIAAHHPLAKQLCEPSALPKLEALKTEVAGRARGVEVETKSGFFTGGFCTHPMTGEKIPVWVGDYVVMDYGTGAVMGVPAHDQRDYEFAQKYSLPLKQVIQPLGGGVAEEGKAFEEPGTLVGSGLFSGLESVVAKTKIADALKEKQLGVPTIQYRLRDWGISRQRYWGAPVPVIYCDSSCGVVLVPKDQLPVELPYDVQITGVGNPLEKHEGFKKTTCPKCKGPARRETDTMDTFVESSWYFARFTDSKNAQEPFNKAIADSWLPVDCYIGGAEHACMHLLYARFFHKVLRDWGYLSGDEPFKKLLAQGMVIKDGAKMSKSKGNVVTPASIIDRFGADTGRLFSLFAAPPEKDLDWNEKGVEGCHRFVLRLWRLFYQFQGIFSEGPGKFSEEPKALSDALMKVRRKTHWTIHKVESDIEESKFNVAISATMELVNEIYSLLSLDGKAFESAEGKWVLREALHNLVLLLSPFAPHLSEELWKAMGERGFSSEATFPSYKPEFLKTDNFTLVVQINGKIRDKVEVSREITKQEVDKLVRELPKIIQFAEGKPIRQVIYVPGKLANIVV